MIKHNANRVCVPMVNHPRALEDVLKVIGELTAPFAAVAAVSLNVQPEMPAVSVLLSPEFLKPGDLEKLRQAGVDYVGIPLDAATPALFNGGGSHLWERYWAVLEEAVAVFGRGKVVCHLVAGMGETERDMAHAMARVSDLGGVTHLSAQVPDGRFRRMQLARFMLDNRLATFQEFRFNREKQLTGVHVSRDLLCSVIEDGEPFMHCGCPGADGRAACSSPYRDCPPGEDPLEYPHEPDEEEIRRIVRQLKDSW